MRSIFCPFVIQENPQEIIMHKISHQSLHFSGVDFIIFSCFTNSSHQIQQQKQLWIMMESWWDLDDQAQQWSWRLFFLPDDSSIYSQLPAASASAVLRCVGAIMWPSAGLKDNQLEMCGRSRLDVFLRMTEFEWFWNGMEFMLNGLWWHLNG